ncbi:sulfurtransferase [Methylosinus sp. R-45379]|uniref:rhodanese-like domain-containing protein n=1 Tax=unclassified Methylosinus TaxID=2624500 RepID=UPI00046413C6|nr:MULTISPECIES: sulfurtransferase [unclassified Methylosinus]OAI31179.1 sulfurtransferase [Methylosinus sp. R-45379]TDX67157.1 rhodanese-related sulfurtransferase [Methylosinus sp. sav-2]
MRASTLFLGLALGVAFFVAGADAQQATAPAAPAAAPVTPQNDPAYTYKTLRLNRAAFDALLAKPEDLLVLDIRRPDELTKVGGFPVYLSIQTKEVQKYLSYIPRDRLIVTVSNRAHRAGAVGDILAGLGFHVVGAIGVLDYQDEGGTLTKIAPPAPAATAAVAAPAAAPAAAAAPNSGAK